LVRRALFLCGTQIDKTLAGLNHWQKPQLCLEGGKAIAKYRLIEV
jgi:hypothetical protein